MVLMVLMVPVVLVDSVEVEDQVLDMLDEDVKLLEDRVEVVELQVLELELVALEEVEEAYSLSGFQGISGVLRRRPTGSGWQKELDLQHRNTNSQHTHQFLRDTVRVHVVDVEKLVLVVLVLVVEVVLEVVFVLLVLVWLTVLLVVLDASGPSRNEFSSKQLSEKRTLRTSIRAPTKPPPVASYEPRKKRRKYVPG